MRGVLAFNGWEAMLGAMEWDARIVGGVNLDGIFRLTLLSLRAHFVTSTTSVLLLELEGQSSRPQLTIVSHPSTQILDIKLFSFAAFYDPCRESS
jgi:hypothetical protein